MNDTNAKRFLRMVSSSMRKTAKVNRLMRAGASLDEARRAVYGNHNPFRPTERKAK